VAYDTNGTELWVRRYNGPNDHNDDPMAITTDIYGNVYVTGYTASFGTSNDYITIAYDSSGNLLWEKRYDGPPNGGDMANDIAVDALGNVYVTGRCITTDFPQNQQDYLTLKYSQFVVDIKANGSDSPISITRSDPLSITIRLDAGIRTGEDADWCLAARTPFGWYYYTLKAGWIPGREVTLQTPLRDVPSREVLNMSGLPAGNYTFYFGVDMVMNGKINMAHAYHDSIKVTISP
jgi:hypothetical protein